MIRYRVRPLTGWTGDRTPRTSQPGQDWRDQALCRETDHA